MQTPYRKIYSIIISISLLSTALSAFANNPQMAGSRWCFGKNHIVGKIDLKPLQFSEIRGVKEGHYNLPAISGDKLRQIVAVVIQPYIDQNLSVTVDNRRYPVRVDKLSRNAGDLYSIWLSVDNVSFHKPVNQVKITYSLLFKETNNTHTNLAFGYLTDAQGAALQKVLDFSPPAFQTTFDFRTPVWELTIKGHANPPPAEHKAWRTSRPQTSHNI
jgi:hypothetical protein